MTKLIFPDAATSPAFLANSEMVDLIDALDWSATAVGPIASWSPALLVTTRMMLANPLPMVMLMGPKGVLIYNDGYAIFAGGRHPGILGLEVAKAWPEIADFNERILAKILRGETLSLKSQKLPLNREGVLEDVWLDLDYSPVLDSDGKPVAELVIVSEITARVMAEQALAASEAGFRVLADSMPQMVWSTRPDGFHDYYNARWYEHTGVPVGSTDGEGWNDLFHPDDREQAWALWRHSLATGDLYQIEYRLKHNSGAYRWTLGRALPIRDTAGGIIRWYGTCTDIHDSKRASEEREVVTQELSHRIKNIFAVLTSIIALSARAYPGMKPFTDQLRERIAAMGTAHDFVRPHSKASRDDDRHYSLRALLQKLVAPYDADGRPRVAFTGDDTPVDDASATPIALVIHELATNAAKYGSLSKAGGHVEVTGSLRDAEYTLNWREIGGPPVVSVPEGQGFGSRLIKLSAEGQLGGKLLQDWDRDGLNVTLVAPVASLNRSARRQPTAA